MKTGVMNWFSLFGKVCCYRISNDFDGYDVGFLSFKIIGGTQDYPRKAIRIVFWRLALWMVI